jgi:hypothetical protein
LIFKVRLRVNCPKFRPELPAFAVAGVNAAAVPAAGGLADAASGVQG